MKIVRKYLKKICASSTFYITTKEIYSEDETFHIKKLKVIIKRTPFTAKIREDFNAANKIHEDPNHH